MFNGLVINPAYAGSQEALSVTAQAKRQWSNVDGAPVTATFSAHSSLNKDKMGLGFIMSNDRISIFSQTLVNAVYSYRILFADNKRLAFGLQAGLSNYNANYSQLTSYTPNDPAIPSSNFKSLSPSFGAGVYYSTPRFFAGLSTPYLASNILKTKYVTNHLELRNNYFLAAGYVVDISNDFKLKPNVLMKYLPGNPIQFDLNANLLFREVLWAGVSYRTSHSMCFLFQVNVTDQLRVGYSYDTMMGKYVGFSGSHELMINYLFSFTKTKIVTPRYF
jgi:type IX secretion system PorP/SprF family membrane protein